MIVDTHCHVSPFWYEPVEGLIHHMEANCVSHAVLVQYMGQFDNSYLFNCLSRFPDKFVVVPLVDHNATPALDEVAGLQSRGAVGIRLRPDSRSPSEDPYAIWKLCERLGLVISCSGSMEEFASSEFADLVSSVPRLQIVLEHMGSINHPLQEQPPFPLRRAVFRLGKFPNVNLKIHGLGEFSIRKKPHDGGFIFRPEALGIVELAFEAFGADRVMWGSDYPPVSGREGYRNALLLTSEHISRLYGEGVLAKVLGHNAARIFKIGRARTEAVR
ncbi:MAG: amidohydrolase family protein [Oricola sp.]